MVYTDFWEHETGLKLYGRVFVMLMVGRGICIVSGSLYAAGRVMG